ncbi:disease resistance protein RPM1-like, partial [Triticum dicoccoides]
MGGLGKTTLVRSIYRSQQLGSWKRAWATALRPFNPEVLLRDLALQLQDTIQEVPAGLTATRTQNKSISVMKLQDLKDELARVLKSKRCLVVLDDISSTSEWDLIKSCLDNAGRIIVTTRQKNVAKKCSREDKNMYFLEGLKDDDALDLFIKKVFKDNIDKHDLVPAMMEQARLILHKCDGLPLAISTIGGFLASKPKNAIEWKKMNDQIRTELEINPELRTIKTILMRSYDGLPYHLKSVFLYLSIFPEDHRIRWGRLVRRWIAEGYSRDMHGMNAVELCRRYFDDLLDRSMILPGE